MLGWAGLPESSSGLPSPKTPKPGQSSRPANFWPVAPPTGKPAHDHHILPPKRGQTRPRVTNTQSYTIDASGLAARRPHSARNTSRLADLSLTKPFRRWTASSLPAPPLPTTKDGHQTRSGMRGGLHTTQNPNYTLTTPKNNKASMPANPYVWGALRRPARPARRRLTAPEGGPAAIKPRRTDCGGDLPEGHFLRAL